MTKEEGKEFANALKNNYTIDFDKLPDFCELAIKALSAEPCREADDYENEIADLHNRLDIAEYDKERYKEEITALESKNKGEWIPVTRRLPEEEHEVYCQLSDGSHAVLYVQDNWGQMEWVDGMMGTGTYDVVAWREKPEPYKAESEE